MAGRRLAVSDSEEVGDHCDENCENCAAGFETARSLSLYVLASPQNNLGDKLEPDFDDVGVEIVVLDKVDTGVRAGADGSDEVEHFARGGVGTVAGAFARVSNPVIEGLDAIGP